ncbi:murein transglycosylase A [Bradyrhizobium prioriisuperbiae]|uniref:murein transglycosylase A n=1 Tax=Bradyrhizobium prioriisuperbiae TaxID=2854389 RepID=UPI0038992E21
MFSLSSDTEARRAVHRHVSHRPVVTPIWPPEIPNSQYAPIGWTEIPGWADDDHLAAFQTFRTSCTAIVAQTKPPADAKALGLSLREPCRVAKAAGISTAAKARDFFEEHFLPLRISKLGDSEGFVTGYYEPIVDGSRTQTDVYNVPLYRRPSNLFVRGFKQSATNLPNGGQVFRKIGRRKLVPYYDRGEIEDGAIAGRGLEICWLKNQTDLLFIQIQGSARIRLQDGSVVRINYDAHNGYRYTPVGRVLIDRNIIPKEQMSMQRIRQWMEENPDGAKELRRQNRSYVFFREVQLSEKDEAVGAQGVQLTAGRSIAVDKALHVYGTPFFIEGNLPLESEQSKTPFRRLMVAQDTGSAIIGPARADIYFGAGDEAGRVSGRLRNGAQFVMLIPKSLDPSARGKTMPLPEARPSAVIAKLFPQQAVPAKDAAAKDPAAAKSDLKDQPAAAASKEVTGSAKPPAVPPVADAKSETKPEAKLETKPQQVPLPEARPSDKIERAAPARPERRRPARHRRHHRHVR